MRIVYPFARPQFDDIEAEILCLIIMYFKPKKIYELSPCGGWSTLYMLSTIEILNLDCKVESFDIEDNCSNLINNFDKIKDKWNFNLGDVSEKYSEFTEEIDYLFIDSDHSEEFTNKYVVNLLNPLLMKLKSKNKKMIVSVHDVFHSDIPSDEGRIVINFLQENNIKYFSANNEFYKNEISKLRNNSNIDKNDVHYHKTNSNMFFILG